jgi:hypothetical protein
MHRCCGCGAGCGGGARRAGKEEEVQREEQEDLREMAAMPNGGVSSSLIIHDRQKHFGSMLKF